MTRPLPFANTYWFAGSLLAGPWPGDEDKAIQRARLTSLIDLGIRAVLDLTTPGEAPGYRVSLARLDDGVAYLNAPIPNGNAPSAAVMSTLLDILDANVANARPTYVHCLGGLGRTGTVVACHWLRHDRCQAEEVKDRLAELRSGQPNAGRPSPETAVQYRLLKSWRPGL